MKNLIEALKYVFLSENQNKKHENIINRKPTFKTTLPPNKICFNEYIGNVIQNNKQLALDKYCKNLSK